MWWTWLNLDVILIDICEHTGRSCFLPKTLNPNNISYNLISEIEACSLWTMKSSFKSYMVCTAYSLDCILDWLIYLYFLLKTFGLFSAWCWCPANLHTSPGEGKGLYFLTTFVSNQELMLTRVIQWTLELTFMSYQPCALVQEKWSFILAVFWTTHTLWNS